MIKYGLAESIITINSVTALIPRSVQQIEEKRNCVFHQFANSSSFPQKSVALSLDSRLIKLGSMLQMVYENVSGSPVVGCKNQVKLPPLCRLLIMAPEHKAHIKDCNIYNLPMGGQD